MQRQTTRPDVVGLSLIRPEVSCSAICEELNRFLAYRNLRQYRSFGYGHSFGVLSHDYGPDENFIGA